MAKRVFKYQPQGGIPGEVEIETYELARVVHVQEQDMQPTIWMEVEDTNPKTTKKFYIAFTGQPLDFDGVHVGTAITGMLVWHVYALSNAS